MKSKKITSTIVGKRKPRPNRPMRKPHHDEQEHIMQVLRILQTKVLGSAVLNGGFDKLIYKIEGIEESQATIVDKVDSIHEAIYHPDDGLFARVKDVEHVKENIEGITQLSNDVATLKQWQLTDDRSDERNSILAIENERKISDYGHQLNDLQGFRRKVLSTFKWVLVTFAGGLATGAGKLIYDFLMGHITIH